MAIATSSDWLTALLERADDVQELGEPDSWLAALAEPSGFVEGMPFGRVDDPREAIVHEAAPIPETPPDTSPPPEPEVDPVAEAFAHGEAAGRAALQAEHEAIGAQQLSLRQSFRALDQAAMDALAGELAETVISLCTAALADYEPARDALLARCREAAQRLGSGAKDATLRLHPDDVSMLEKEALPAWRVIADPVVERGGLRFETQNGSISDTPSDWRRAIAAAIRG